MFTAVCTVGLAQFPVVDMVYDDFEDGYINRTRWQFFNGPTGSTVSEYGGRMMFFHPSTASGEWFGVGLNSRCELIGDFDIQVDYDLLIWPNGPENPDGGYFGNGIRTALYAADAGVERPSWEGHSPGDVYFFPGDDAIPTDHTSGTLRLTRSGEEISGYYYDVGAWAFLGTTVGSGGPTLFSLGSWSHDGAFVQEDILVAFDNFLVNSGDLLCPRDQLLADVDIKPGSDRNTINVRSRGVIPVAILGTQIVDVYDIDPGTVQLSKNYINARKGKGMLEDVNDDGVMDMILHFPTADLFFREGQMGSCLRGYTWGGRFLRGCNGVTLHGFR